MSIMSDIKFVEYNGVQYKILSDPDHMDYLNLSGLGIEDITEVKNLEKLKT